MKLLCAQIETVTHAVQSVYTQFGAVRFFHGVGDAVYRVLFGEPQVPGTLALSDLRVVRIDQRHRSRRYERRDRLRQIQVRMKF